MIDGHRAARIWWIARNQLAGSRNPTHKELRALRSDGFASLICLLNEHEQPLSYLPSGAKEIGYTWWSMPIFDHCAPSIDQMLEFARIVDERLAEGKVLVHCWAGWGRTGTMGAAYLVNQGLTATMAIASVRRVCPLAIETREQEASLFALEDALKQERLTAVHSLDRN
jgi:atypical dual specificity phosphatase